ncbi:MAG TPA: hypothetical protein VGG39_05485 [Polyangiaceae bacterium]|jgi:hypothetical protein
MSRSPLLASRAVFACGAALALVAVSSCTKGETHAEPVLTAPWSDDFDRADLGADWNDTGGPYRIENGALVFEKAHNHPLWLRRPLPDDVRIDVDATGLSAEGDVKVILAGDGESHESDDAVRRDLKYTDTGYVFIYGGWHDHLSTLVRLEEHEWENDHGVPRNRTARVVPGQTMHWTITKHGGHLEWDVDGQTFLVRDDPSPLTGPGHSHFAFTGWESPVRFDNLKITPL